MKRRTRPKAPTPAELAFARAFYTRPAPDPLTRDSSPAGALATTGDTSAPTKPNEAPSDEPDDTQAQTAITRLPEQQNNAAIG